MYTSRGEELDRHLVVSPLKRDAGYLDKKLEMGYDKYLQKQGKVENETLLVNYNC
jgi:hypothetical protein